MGAVIGIDLGTTFCAVATLDETGRPIIVHNQEGQNITPSCVALDGPNSILVGEVSRRIWTTSTKNRAAARFKRDMGTSVTYQIEDKHFTPTELSTFVLKKLLKDATTSLGQIHDAVVTIPANFSNEAREATMAAAKAAGLNISYIINEPTAAALYYSFKSGQDMHGNYVVYDLGGGTFDVSVIKVDGQNIEVLATNGIIRLGGIDFDEALQAIVAKKFKEVSGKELEANQYSRGQAEDDKKSLSIRKSVTVDVGFQAITVTREEFEQSISSRIAQAEMLCEATIADAKLLRTDISEVFLAGGSTRLPIVRESINRVFGMEPTSTVNVDEVVALGAALYAAYKGNQSKLTPVQRGSVNQIQVIESTSMCYGTLAMNNSGTLAARMENSVIITKGTRIPCSVTEIFYTQADGQTVVGLEITESTANETDPAFVKILWRGTLELPGGRPMNQPISVTYSYDENQIMHCSFVDVTSGRKTEVQKSIISQGAEGVTSVDQFLVE